MYTIKIKKMKWRTKLEVVDKTTGEEISKKRVKNGEYIIITKNIKHEKIDELNGITRITWICENSKQLRLF